MKHENKLASRRGSARLWANGVVAMTISGDEPIISRINDIAPGGISFFHAEARVKTDSEVRMDIVIFDDERDNDCFLDEVRGLIKSVQVIRDRQSEEPIWRYSIEFIEIKKLQQNNLKAYLNKDPKRLWHLSQPMG